MVAKCLNISAFTVKIGSLYETRPEPTIPMMGAGFIHPQESEVGAENYPLP